MSQTAAYVRQKEKEMGRESERQYDLSSCSQKSKIISWCSETMQDVLYNLLLWSAVNCCHLTLVLEKLLLITYE